MTHEISPVHPEGGEFGEDWLEDAASVIPELLPGVPVGDLADDDA